LNGKTAALSVDDRVPETVDVHGMDVPSFTPLVTPSHLDVTFPVDAVYLWVDGQDPAWQERKAMRLAGLTQPPRAESTEGVRFDQGDELRFSLRSMERYAPWIRRIFVITDGQRPPWLVEQPGRLDVVDHTEILDGSCLPTFNSHAITGAVHRIDGLAEHFLLMNDDVMLGRPVTPQHFFVANGVTRFFPSQAALPAGPLRDDDAPLVAARKRSRDLVEALTGSAPVFGFKHTPVPFSRQLLAELEHELPAWQATLRSPFRSGEDIVPSWLHHYVGFARRATVPSAVPYRYFDIGSESAIAELRKLIAQARRPATLCVNDVTDATIAGRHRHDTLNAILDQLFPRPSSFERPTSVGSPT
jgi:hypothetical protein